MAITNNERVGKGLALLSDGLAPFVERECQAKYGDGWMDVVESNGPASKTDVQFLLKVMTGEWRAVFERVLGRSDRSFVFETRDIRNKWAHQETFTTDDAYRALDTIHRVLTAVAAGEQAAEVDRLKQELLRTRFAEEARRVRRRQTTTGTEGTPDARLKPWREIVTPHPDVASGRYQQAEFAADLHQVWRDEAADEYGKPEEFFRRTYLTEGLRDLLLNATRRLRGEGGDPIVELQTNFGGGKTHSLIALYHLAGGYPPAKLAGVEQMLAEAGLGAPPAAKIAVLVGQMIAPGSVHEKPDGPEVRTLWGELAWQVGGTEGYALVADADRTATNPGEALIRLLEANAPCLILIDEWVAYARLLYGVDGLPAGSFDAQFTFAQALCDAARRVPNAMLVVSIPASDIEVGGLGGREALTRLHNVVGRMETSWKPATADEGFEIVRRRLYEEVSPDLARERDAVVRAFGDLYRANRGDFPSECGEAEYERRLTASYPIHPELFDRLYNEWSTLERFQRTRGVLRLMAAVIHELWEREDKSLLITPGTMPIDAGPVVAELTRYLEEGWTPVIATDVDGENSLPLRIDRENPSFGRYSAARRVARTVYMGSAPITEAVNRGIDDRRIRLGCVQPGESPATFGDALRRLANQATYLNTDGQRYWYSLQQTVTRLAADRATLIAEEDADEEIRRRIRDTARTRGDFAAVHAAPRSAAEVPDEAEARLVVIGPEHPHARTEESPARAFAESVLEERAAGPRLNRNMLVFLAADAARLEELRDAAKQLTAWRSIDEEKDSLNLDTIQRAQATARVDEWDRTLAHRIGEAYQWLLVPSASKDDPAVAWQETRATGSDPLAVRASKKLENEESLITAWSGTRLRMELDRIPLWRGDRVSVAQLWSDFAQYLYLPRLRDPGVLRAAIENGVSQITWEQDGFGYAQAYDEAEGRYRSLAAGMQASALIDTESVLVKPEVAKEQLGDDGAQPPAPRKPPPDEPNTVPRRYHGSVVLDPTRVSRDVDEIAREVIQHLAGLVGAEVEVRLEIAAEVADGVPDEVIRTVTENARTLKIEGGFERE